MTALGLGVDLALIGLSPCHFNTPLNKKVSDVLSLFSVSLWHEPLQVVSVVQNQWNQCCVFG